MRENRELGERRKPMVVFSVLEGVRRIVLDDR
jgi:hypothetical protein